MTVYVEALNRRIQGEPLQAVRLASPFVLRSVEPPIGAASGKRVLEVRRLGKQLVLALEDGLFLVIHLMVSGRLHWKERGAKVAGKMALAAFDFPSGTVTFTEASSKKRASLHLVQGEEALRAFDRGGLEVLEAELPSFRERLLSENHTLKRALTDPRLFSGIGNAYSDEILHRARLSPVRLTRQLSEEEIEGLYLAVRDVLKGWTSKLRSDAGDGFPEKVTAFREGMAVHGRHRQPCPVCGSSVQRIVYAENETDYCATCQTGGKLLADRALSRLLKEDWPRTVDELEQRRAQRAGV